MPAARMPVRTVHLIPQFFLCQRVLADKERPELLIDDDSRFFLDWPVKAFGVIRFDAHIIRADRRRLRRAGIRIVFIGGWSKFVVNMEGIDLILSVDPAHRLPMAAVFPNLDGFDFDRLRFGESGRRQDRQSRQKSTARNSALHRLSSRFV
jgi:hypothetical protein